MKVLSLFSGIGAFEKALDNIGINYELVNFCEFDKYATKSYCTVHGVDESKNLGDITKVNEKELPKDIDLITYGFPCQDISVAGKGKGFFDENGNTTRSGLFFEALRIIEETKPKYAIAENVKNLVSKKFATEFEIVLDALDEAGYNNYWKVLNTKDFGIPQNRERVFIVSIRKDIDDGSFEFPEGFPLELKLKDMLEDEVEEKYFLNDSKIAKIYNSNFGQEKAMIQKTDVCGTLLARDYKDPKCVAVADFRYDEGLRVRKSGVAPCITTHIGSESLSGNTYIIDAKPIVVGQAHEGDSQSGKVYSMDGISPTMVAGTHGYAMGYIEVKEGTKKGYTEATEGDSINLGFPSSTTRRGRVGHQVSQTLDTSCNMGVVENLRIRKLTPKECWRLQGFDDESFERAAKVNSNTQLYKQAGNSITVKVLEYLFKALFKEGDLT